MATFNKVDTEAEAEASKKQEDLPLEVEIVDDAVEGSEEAEQQKVEAEKAETTKRESRVQRLKRQRDAERARNAELFQGVMQLKGELDEIKKSQGTNLKVGYDAAEKNLEEAIQLAESAHETAFDTGNKEALRQATRQLAALEARRALLQEKRAELPEATPVQPQRQAQPQPQRQQQPQVDNTRAREWATENKWFMAPSTPEETRKRRMAFVINDELIEEGFDPGTDEFYEEIDKRLETEPQAQRPSPVGGGRPRGSNPNKVVLTKEQVADAARKGIPLDAYAKSVRMPVNDMGYTPIDLG